jgi:hypothetical protein
MPVSVLVAGGAVVIEAVSSSVHRFLILTPIPVSAPVLPVATVFFFVSSIHRICFKLFTGTGPLIWPVLLYFNGKYKFQLNNTTINI